MLKQDVASGVGSSLDQKRRCLKTKMRSWLGRPPRNSGRQYPVSKEHEALVQKGDLLSLDVGKAIPLRAGKPFLGCCSGVGGDSGSAFAAVRLGTMWERIQDLNAHTDLGSDVFADPNTGGLNLSAGVRIGILRNREEFAGDDWRGHVELIAS